MADPSDFDAASFLDYAQGFNLTNRMPLFVRPRAGLAVADLHRLLSSHFEGTWFDASGEVGAGAEHAPYRWNGLTWQVAGDNATYVNERVVGTQYQAWHFVAEVAGSNLDPALPAPMRALQWWGSDEHTWAPKVPPCHTPAAATTSAVAAAAAAHAAHAGAATAGAGACAATGALKEQRAQSA